MNFRSQTPRQNFADRTNATLIVMLGVSVLIAFSVLVGCDPGQPAKSETSVAPSSAENSTYSDNESNMNSEPMDRKNKTPQAKSNFENAVTLERVAEAKEFLNGLGSGKLVRIPVAIEAGPLGVGKCILGVETNGPSQVEIDLDDSAMGISLADRIRDYSSSDQWTFAMVTGYWNKRTIPNLPVAASDEIPFQVRDVEPLDASTTSNHGLFVEVAK